MNTGKCATTFLSNFYQKVKPVDNLGRFTYFEVFLSYVSLNWYGRSAFSFKEHFQ